MTTRTDNAASEARALRRVRARLTRFCDATIRSGLAATPGLRIQAVVLTRFSLSDPTRQAITDLVTQFVACDLPQAALDGVAFGTSAGLRGPCDVRIEPVTPDGGGHAGRRVDRVDERWPRLHVSLIGDGVRTRLHVTSGPGWVPVTAGPVTTGPALLEIRYRRGPVDWRRADARPDYTVEIDGRVLPPGQTAPAVEWGTIVFRTGARPTGAHPTGSGRLTLLEYHITWDGKS